MLIKYARTYTIDTYIIEMKLDVLNKWGKYTYKGVI